MPADAGFAIPHVALRDPEEETEPLVAVAEIDNKPLSEGSCMSRLLRSTQESEARLEHQPDMSELECERAS